MGTQVVFNFYFFEHTQVDCVLATLEVQEMLAGETDVHQLEEMPLDSW